MNRMYTDRDYLEEKFEGITTILTQIRADNVALTNRVSTLENWKREMVVKIGMITALVSIAFTLLKDWILDKLNIRI